ncbi:general transcription factor IIF subunit 2 [Aplysia californica]|uniref:General transcription factor IIF subunit 2 n=1 Tax=Aplysia californica TaxID=6500 RepID=A0ABM1VUM5_APLCA|nr:general transcription factor IIF subunit 2 [Aplysia californica]
MCLLLVPKYLSEQWKKCPSGKDVGKLKISKPKIPNKKPDIVFTSYDVSAKAGGATAMASGPSAPISTLPVAPKPPARNSSIRNHKFVVTSVANQNLVVMSQIKSDNIGRDPASDKICVEGKVLQRAECHPIVDDNYRLLKKEQVQAQNTPARQIKLLPGIVQSYKPVSDHYNNVEERKAKKTEAKRSRAEKEKVMDILFNAFEKHQFYNVKDLVGITQQPVVSPSVNS